MKNDSGLGSPLIEEAELQEVVEIPESGWLRTSQEVTKSYG